MRDSKGFSSLTPLKEAREILTGLVSSAPVETISLREGLGRVTAGEITAPRAVPHFRRAAMDGFALSARSTFGASRSAPRRLQVREDEERCGGEVAFPVSTGAEVPDGADAVVKIEDCRREGDRLFVLKPLPPGKNVAPVGEDVEKGTLVLKKGVRISPEDLALLRSLGVEQISVRHKPRVALIPTGEELIPPGKLPQPGQAVESNGIMIGSYVENWGGESTSRRCLTDAPDRLKGALRWGLRSDIVVFIGGSSVGERDRVVQVIDEQGELAVHGVGLRPGKPVGIGTVEGKPVLCLPGYPVAALADAILLLKPALDVALGIEIEGESSLSFGRREVELGSKVDSELGLVSFVRARVEEGLAFPIRSAGAGVLSSVTRSDGYLLIDRDSEGKEAGESVFLYQFGQP